MLVIRLSRQGRKNLQMFKIVVQEKTKSPKSNFVEILGSYNPADEANAINIKKDRVEHYLKNGAQPSDTMARLLKKAGIDNMEKFIKQYTHQVNEEKLKAEQEAKEAAEAEAKAKAEAEAAEKEAAEAAPADEAPAEEKAEDAPAADETPAEEDTKEDAPAEEEKPAEDAAEEDKKEES